LTNDYNISRTGLTIAAARPFLVGLQEVDNLTSRHPGDDQMAILSRITGMNFAFGKMRDFEGGGYGIGILSRFPILEAREFHYYSPGQPPRTPAECAIYKENDYCGGLLAVRLQIPGFPKRFWFATTHFGLGEQLSHLAPEFMAYLDSIGDPFIVTGDFNSVPTSLAVRTITQRYADMWPRCGPKGSAGFTFDAGKPFERIDYHFWGNGTTLTCANAARVLDTQTSDHRPVVADYSWKSS